MKNKRGEGGEKMGRGRIRGRIGEGGEDEEEQPYATNMSTEYKIC
jgi:hypothetical protein